MKKKVALITGITGQDGSYLAELLLSKKYIVWGIIRRASNINTQRIEHLYKNDDFEDMLDGADEVSEMFDSQSDLYETQLVFNK